MPSKTLTNTNFAVLMLEVQEHLQDGWIIDEKNYPVSHFVFYEVNLVKNNHAEAIAEVFPDTVVPSDVVEAKRPGRPARKAAQ